MHTNKFVYFLLFTAVSQAYAGAGQTSAGVTTTVPTDPTAATQDVQSQSSNFAQQNQSLAASNGATGPNGTIIAAGAAGAARPGGATDANGRPINDPNNPAGDPRAANQAPVVPAAPPAPPPEYVSNIKKVDRTAVAAAVTPPVADVADKKPAASPTHSPAADIDTSVVTAPGVQRQAAATQKPEPRPAAEATERTGAERVAPGTGSSGGSGSPPDSFAFYIGLIVAGALLAFAAAMFLRTEKGGAR